VGGAVLSLAAHCFLCLNICFLITFYTIVPQDPLDFDFEVAVFAGSLYCEDCTMKVIGQVVA
jgi:hypothetical protein